MKQLLQLTEKAVRNIEAIAKSAKSSPHTKSKQRYGITHELPRVHTIQPSGDNDRRITRNMAKYTQLVPRVSPTAAPRVENQSKMAQYNLPLNNQMITRNKVCIRRHAQARLTVSDIAPACNTQSQTRAMPTASSTTRLSTKSSKRLLQLMWTTPEKRNKTTQTEHAAAIGECLRRKQLRQTTCKFNNL